MADRRQYPRSVVHWPVIVSLGKTKAGLLFDLSESGLSVRGLVPKSQDEVTPVAFDLPESDGLIEASVRIAWTSNLANRTGMRFVQVGDTSQQQLREWLGARPPSTDARLIGLERDIPGPASISRASDLLATSISQANVAAPRLQLGDESTPFKSAVTANVELGPHRDSRPRFPLLATVLMFPALVLVGYYSASILEKLKVNKLKVGSKTTTQFPSSGVTVNSSTTGIPDLPIRLSVDQPGFVLQVGAMAYEEHADALAAALNQRNFPAFVFRRTGDRFYRVAVGPYGDVDSSTKMKGELEKQNFEAILRRWAPQ